MGSAVIIHYRRKLSRCRLANFQNNRSGFGVTASMVAECVFLCHIWQPGHSEDSGAEHKRL